MLANRPWLARFSIDAIGLARGGAHEGELYRGILNQVLACMDGLQGDDIPIFVLGATNRVQDLDPA